MNFVDYNFRFNNLFQHRLVAALKLDKTGSWVSSMLKLFFKFLCFISIILDCSSLQSPKHLFSESFWLSIISDSTFILSNSVIASAFSSHLAIYGLIICGRSKDFKYQLRPYAALECSLNTFLGS